MTQIDAIHHTCKEKCAMMHHQNVYWINSNFNQKEKENWQEPKKKLAYLQNHFALLCTKNIFA